MGQHAQLRIGSRAEYQFQSVLSRYCQVIPVPRQEDFGEDFVCATLIADGDSVLQGIRFRVQVKSSMDALTRAFGGARQGRDEVNRVRWLLGRPPFHVATDPLLLAVSDPASGTVEIYAPQHIWEARYYAGTPTEMVFSKDAPPRVGRGRRTPIERFTSDRACTPDRLHGLPADAGDKRRWTVPLGPPILRLPQVESVKPSVVPSWFHEVVEGWANIEHLNRAMATQNIPLAWTYDDWTTNAAPVEADLLIRTYWSDTPGQNLPQTEFLAHSLVACLRANYQKQGTKELARALRGAAEMLTDRVNESHPDLIRDEE